MAIIGPRRLPRHVGIFSGQVYVHGNYAYVPRYSNIQQSTNDKWSHQRTLELYIVDISNRTAPRLTGKFSLDPVHQDQGENYAGIVQTDSALLIGRSTVNYDEVRDSDDRPQVEFFYDIIDLSDPSELKVVKRFEVPSLLASGGWGYGMSGCTVDMDYGWWGYSGYGSEQNALVSGDLVVSQHEEALSDGSGRVRYYLDRIDVSNPQKPVLLPQVNIPGNVVHFDGDTQRIVTIDYLFDEKPARDWDECYGGNFTSYFDEEEGSCRTYRRRLNVLESEGRLCFPQGHEAHRRRGSGPKHRRQQQSHLLQHGRPEPGHTGSSAPQPCLRAFLRQLGRNLSTR